jgi:hypothetical protein
VPVTTEYLVASQVLAGKSFNTGAAPYQDFKLLIDLRNADYAHQSGVQRRSALGAARGRRTGSTRNCDC